METNNNMSSTSGQEPTLMKKISNTISSLMPGSNSTTKADTPYSTQSSEKDNSIFEEVITESRTKTQTPSKLMSDLDKASPVDSDSPADDSGLFSSFGELFKNVYFKVIMLILILAFLGLNLFKYLADATDNTTDILGDPIKQIAAIFGYTVGETTKNIVDTSAEGTKLGIDVAAGATEEAIDLGQKALGASSTTKSSQSNDFPTESSNSSKKSSSDSKKSEPDDLDKAINTSSSSKKKSTSIPEPDDATSRTQSSKASKSGYCYIGEDRGFRSCIKVNDPNRCMSGEIFPTRDICINPTLRE